MKHHNNDIGGKVIKSNAVYTLVDNTNLKNLILSQTILHVNQNTNGHYHEGQEEVYFFVYGKGRMIVGENEFEVSAGDIVLIPKLGSQRIVLEGQDYFICKESDILAIIE